MNKTFWKKYYSENHSFDQLPTSFAKYCIQYFPKNATIIDLGCGNGRDSIFFQNCGFSVYGVDQCEKIIGALNNRTNSNNYFSIGISELGNTLNENLIKSINVVYARFFVHAISKEEESDLMQFLSKLKKHTLFFAESRSIDDKNFAKGKKISQFTYSTDHARRFTNKNDLENKLRNINYKIIESNEDTGLAIYNDENPLIIRIIASKHK